jgi:protoheme IX farnesyltransferase
VGGRSRAALAGGLSRAAIKVRRLRITAGNQLTFRPPALQPAARCNYDVTSIDSNIARPVSGRWRLYLQLTKPKVVALIVLTAVVGTLLATPGWPSLTALLFGNLGIGLAAASAATLNQILDQRIDARMTRTRSRPLPTGGLTEGQALGFAVVLGTLSMLILWFLVNPLTAVLTFASLIGYAVVYTLWLKRATPQNIVIGGAAGAAPPVLGWAAVTGTVDPHALLLFLIIFAWTPPHFWALAIARRDDYAKVGIPMLPVTHGIAYTRLHVLLYTVILVLVTLLPYLTRMSGLVYLVVALGLNAAFLSYAIRLKMTTRTELPMKVFRFSVQYLMWLFLALLADHYLLTSQLR